MSLRREIDQVRRGAAVHAAGLTPQAPDALASAALALPRRFHEGSPATDLAERAAPVLRRLMVAGPGGLEAADWNLVAAALWVGEPAPAADREILAAYLAWLERDGHRAAWRRLIDSYLAAFRPDLPGLRPVAASLVGAVDRWRWSWAERHRRFGLFDPDAGPSKVARHALTASTSVAAALQDAGLGGERGRGGMARAVFIAAVGLVGALMGRLAAMPPAFADGAAPPAGQPDLATITRLLDRLLPWGFDGDRLTFHATEGALATGLLAPWGRSTPDRALATRLIQFFLQALGDPRLDAPGWREVPPEARAVFRRWLVATALSQYLPVVEALGFDGRGLRRAFWMGYFTAGHISDAWGVYATPFTRATLGGAIAVGQLESAPGVEAGHVVLLMRIGTAIVADWSHSGRCHIWRSDEPSAPKLHEPRYAADALRLGSLQRGIVHSRGEAAVWQRQVAALLAEHGGVDLPERAFMPGGRR